MITPVSFRQTQKSAHWRAAMQTEYNALMQNKTWVLIPPNTAQNVVDCRWVLKSNKSLMVQLSVTRRDL